MSTLVPSVPDLTIIVPAYNEVERIAPTLHELHRFLTGGALGWEILVVDDGSSDGTADLVERLGESIPGLRVHRCTPNRGKGAAVRTGMLVARGRIRVMWDADGSMPAAMLPRLLAPILAGDATIAIGSRYAPGATTDRKQPRYRVMWSRLCNKAIQRALVPGVSDTQCGYKAFTADTAADLFARATIDGWAFDLEVLALGKQRGYDIAEVGVHWTDDRRSRVNPIKDMWKVIREAVVIRRNLKKQAYGRLPAESY